MDPLTRLLGRVTLEKSWRRTASGRPLQARSKPGHAGCRFIFDCERGWRRGDGDLLLTCLAGVILTSIGRWIRRDGIKAENSSCSRNEPRGGRDSCIQQLATIATAVAGIELTFSASIVGLPEDGGDLDTILPRLEQALNQAKAESGPGSVYQWGIGLAPAEESAGA